MEHWLHFVPSFCTLLCMHFPRLLAVSWVLNPQMPVSPLCVSPLSALIVVTPTWKCSFPHCRDPAFCYTSVCSHCRVSWASLLVAALCLGCSLDLPCLLLESRFMPLAGPFLLHLNLHILLPLGSPCLGPLYTSKMSYLEGHIFPTQLSSAVLLFHC